MKFLKVIIKLISLSVLLCSCNDNEYNPPSKYVGFFTKPFISYKYSGEPYSGKWVYKFPSGEMHSGYYTNGIPSGIWQMRLADKSPFLTCHIEKDGTYRSMSYYKDSFPSFITTGTYDVKDNILSYRANNTIFFNEIGEVIDENSWDYQWKSITTLYTDGDFVLENTTYSYDITLQIFKDKKFKILLYVFIDDDEENQIVCKNRTTGNLLNTNIENFENHTYYGDFQLFLLNNENEIDVFIFENDEKIKKIITLGESFFESFNTLKR